MSKPPPLPTEVLARVVRLSGIDGRILVIVAGGFGLLSLAGGDWLGAGVGALALGAGVVELSGRKQLQAGETTGILRLVSSQLLLLAVVLGYAAYQYFRYDPLPLLAKFEKALAEAQAENGLEQVSLAELFGMSSAQFHIFVKQAVRSTYLAVALASILCQGGLAYYYHHKGAYLQRYLRKS